MTNIVPIQREGVNFPTGPDVFYRVGERRFADTREPDESYETGSVVVQRFQARTCHNRIAPDNMNIRGLKDLRVHVVSAFGDHRSNYCTVGRQPQLADKNWRAYI